MSNSPLVNYTKISPNSTNPRNKKITKITIHHMAGNLSVEQCGNEFAPKSKRASSNYGIDSKGRVGMYVEEKNRSWCSSNSDNDNRAITIEVANDVIGGNWHVSDKALAKLIDLCVDICERNHIEKLNFTGDATGNLTMHKWFAATACPGAYLESKFPYIAEEVNKRLQKKTTVSKPKETTSKVKKGDLVKLSTSAVYYEGGKIPSWVKKLEWYVDSVSGDRAIINKDKTGEYAICSPVNTKYLTVVGDTTNSKITKGDLVELSSSAVYYDGEKIPDWVKKSQWYVDSVSGDRAIINKDKTKQYGICSPINIKYLTKVK